jgi:hypothetical protein
VHNLSPYYVLQNGDCLYCTTCHRIMFFRMETVFSAQPVTVLCSSEWRLSLLLNLSPYYVIQNGVIIIVLLIIVFFN